MTAPVQRTSVYIGDLPTDLPRPEEAVNNLFSSVAPVMSVKVCRDMATQRSLGYAYVNFQTTADAEKVIDALNYTDIVPGRQIRVMFSIRDPLQRKSGMNNVFVKKLEPSINAKALQTAFSKCGRVLSCKVALDAEGKSKGYGFVQFENAEGAKAALEMNGAKIGANEVEVATFVRRADRDALASKSFTSVYIKNIKGSATEAELTAALEKFGKLQSLFLAEHPPFATKFALAAFEQHEAAVKAIAELNEKIDSGLTEESVKLVVCRALSKSERDREKKKAASLYQNHGRNLYVKHLPEDITEEKLHELFEPYGKITSCALMKDGNGIFKGFAFVCFEDRECATTAMRTLNGQSIENSKKPLYVSQAEQKDMRIRLLQQRRAAMRHQSRMAPPMAMFPQQWPRQPFPQMAPPMMPPPPPPNMGMPQFMSGPMMRRPMMQHGMPGQPMRVPNRYTQPREQYQPVRHEGVDVNYLGTLAPEQQKNYLGELLYGKIMPVESANAAKITGMLLEMSREEIFEVLADPNSLMAKIQEANAVLQQHASS
ncbi:putative mitochondrial poly(A)-binding protein [Leptomonas pyrrhocoris]|uniref:Putative mitochondrial poly(A)-binding protein n=1 Tax=Leptomonas pyrrhocoris TaxID=157538 RepID=A0A0N0DUU2_LEPPY|nr:putative mitochondrial poly(A)-binding protein [Leptomonas pyrrhocoris]XP_015657830.1 putative mitochondrial poly(A)-binding protein [Leptomonas pyrrhocoris]KPA79390.1 putative mitochondrial poly(A)-binding protein [Leptomonas pyrrhocoris]KPA79391.1 putative mitochondrial poly(A)-binding protein [Leptomonas pyrrhocoris]|eukprot:XP_015657829.1 putative mitochondrial poly(A)-binding protein [Leptomonas pyrrhocoris]